MGVLGVGAVQARNIYIYIFIIPTLFGKPKTAIRSRIQCIGMTGLSGGGRVGGGLGEISSFSGDVLLSCTSAAHKQKELRYLMFNKENMSQV